MSQHWPLSQNCSKSSGQCSVCKATRQLHLRDGLIHVHGPRNNPCPGSNKPPLETLSSTIHSPNLPKDFLRLADASFIEPAPRQPTSLELNTFSHPQVFTAVIKHVPKSARSACAKLLSDILPLILNDYTNVKHWNLLFNFASTIFTKPGRSSQINSLSSIIKKRTINYITNIPDQASIPCYRQHHRNSPDEQLSKAITAKINDGNIKSALRLLLSDDKLAENNDDTYTKLQERHPVAAKDRRPPPAPSPLDICLQVSEQEVKHAVKSFPLGSAGGPDGLRPQHITDLVSCRDNGPSLLTIITAFVNMLLKGQCATDVIPFLFGANLTALTKKSGGIRPIAVGYYWRRLSAKCANSFATNKLATYFSPIQQGVGVPGGCEGAIHACRRFVLNMPDDFLVVKLDFSNAFNCLHRDSMLESIKQSVPEIYSFCLLSYSNDSVLKFGSRQILSQEGIQKGDPLGPLLFCLTIHPIFRELESPFTIGFMDDITIGGPEPLVANDVKHINTIGATIGLNLNFIKCEQINKFNALTSEPIGQFSHCTISNAILFGAPFVPGSAMDSALEKKLDELKEHLIVYSSSQLTMRSYSFVLHAVHQNSCTSCVHHHVLVTHYYLTSIIVFV